MTKAYGITYEPIVFIYNKRLLKEEQVPKSRAAIANMDQATIDLLKGKVITQDPERIGSALLFVTRDLKYDKNFWNLAQSLGKTDVKLYTSSGTILERLTSGEASFGYDVMANYPHSRSKTDPAVGIVYPEDYILVNPRVAFIWKDAAHPNAAKVFLDYVLSARGQTLIAKSLFSIRPDVQGEFSATRAHRQIWREAASADPRCQRGRISRQEEASRIPRHLEEEHQRPSDGSHVFLVALRRRHLDVGGDRRAAGDRPGSGAFSTLRSSCAMRAAEPRGATASC